MTASVIQVGRGPEGVEGRLLRGDAQTSVAGQATPHASCGNKERRSPLKALELGLPQVFHLCPTLWRLLSLFSINGHLGPALGKVLDLYALCPSSLCSSVF